MNPPPNPAHALDGGIPGLLHTERYWPAASDEQRYQNHFTPSTP